MAVGTQVASLFGLLGLKVDKKSWADGEKKIDGITKAIAGAAMYFGGRFLGKALVGFNSSIEESKNQIAGMLALSKKTDLADQVGNADRLYANLQKRAASLPGTTQEYVNMLGMLTQPVTAAGLGLEDLENLTVNAVVAAKAMGVEWETAARDIDQALRAQFKSTDQLTGKLLASMGYAGEEGRAKFNALSEAARAATLKAALTQKQITQLAEAQGKSFKGRLSTLQDAAEQFLGRIGKALFAALGTTMERATKWIENNKQAIDETAEAIGSVLAGAFQTLGTVFDWLAEHGELVKAVMIALGIVLTAVAVKAAIAWVAATWPILAVLAALTAIIYVVRDVVRYFRTGESKIAKAWKGLSGKLRTGIKLIAMVLLAPFIGMHAAAVLLFDKVRALPGKMIDAFRAIGAKIKAFFVGVFDWIVSEVKALPGRIKNAAVGFANDVWDTLTDSPFDNPAFKGTPFYTGDAPAKSSPAAGGPVSIGPTTINVSGAGDPSAVASLVRREFDNHWGGMLEELEDVS